MLRYLTGGESHGKCNIVIIDGMPSGLGVKKSAIDKELSRRMLGYGRGRRMKIESDRVEILSGVRKGVTLGSPITLKIDNKDQSLDTLPVVLNPRPAHADLTGALKYSHHDIRNVLERSSARETVARVAAGAVAKEFLSELGIEAASHVIAIGSVVSTGEALEFGQIVMLSSKSPVCCADKEASRLMCEEIDSAAASGDTLGGVFEVIVRGAPPGLGSYVQWDRKIDARLARAMISIQAIKGVSFGAGFDAAEARGSDVHDEIFYDKKKGFYRKTNNAGGIEGGMTTGEDIVIKCAMKPIATLMKPLSSVNIKTKKSVRASVERSDTCAVPAAAVIGENVVALEMANAVLEKFGGDSMKEIVRNLEGYMKQVRRF